MRIRETRLETRFCLALLVFCLQLLGCFLKVHLGDNGGGGNGSGGSSNSGVAVSVVQAVGVEAIAVGGGGDGGSVALNSDGGGSGDGGDGSGVGNSGDGSVGNGDSGGGDASLVGPVDLSGSLPDVDDGLTGNGDGVLNVVGLVHVDGHGHLDDLLPDDGHIIGDLDPPLDGVGLVHHMGLLDGLDDGGVDGDGSLEGGRHGDGQLGDGGLVDARGVAGDELGLAEVQLLADDGSGLVDGLGGHTVHRRGGVGGGHAHGRGGGSVGHGGNGGSHSHGGGGHGGVVSGGSAGGHQERSKGDLQKCTQAYN